MKYIEFLLDALPKGIITSGNDCRIQLQLFDNRHKLKKDGKTPSCASFGGYIYFNGTHDGNGSYQFITTKKYNDNISGYVDGFANLSNQDWHIAMWNWYCRNWHTPLEDAGYTVRIGNYVMPKKPRGKIIIPNRMGFLVMKDDDFTPIAARIIDGTADCRFPSLNEHPHWQPGIKKDGKLQARWWKTNVEDKNEIDDVD